MPLAEESKRLATNVTCVLDLKFDATRRQRWYRHRLHFSFQIILIAHIHCEAYFPKTSCHVTEYTQTLPLVTAADLARLQFWVIVVQSGVAVSFNRNEFVNIIIHNFAQFNLQYNRKTIHPSVTMAPVILDSTITPVIILCNFPNPTAVLNTNRFFVTTLGTLLRAAVNYEGLPPPLISLILRAFANS